MTDLKSLHAAILHDASNDTLRLAYADALDEEESDNPRRVKCRECDGTGQCDAEHLGWWECPKCEGRRQVLDTTHSDHAALIRGMVAGEVYAGKFVPDTRYWNCYGFNDRYPADSPQQHPNRNEWHTIMRAVLGNAWLPANGNTPLTFRAGFPSLVDCTTQWWLDHGPQVVRRYPVEKVTLAGRDVETWVTRPDRNANREGQVWWYRNLGAMWHDALPKQLLPQELFDRLTGERDQLPGNAGCNYCWYPTRDAALADLSHAAIQWAWEAIPTPIEAHT